MKTSTAAAGVVWALASAGIARASAITPTGKKVSRFHPDVIAPAQATVNLKTK
jgi:hypothetical protein